MKTTVFFLLVWISAAANASSAKAEFSVLPGDEVRVACEVAPSAAGNFSSISADLSVEKNLATGEPLKFETYGEFSLIAGAQVKPKNGSLVSKEKFRWEFDDDYFHPKPSSFAAGTIAFDPSGSTDGFARVVALFGTPTRNSKPVRDVSAIRLESAGEISSSLVQYKKEAPYVTICTVTPLCRDHGRAIRVAIGTPGTWSANGSGSWDACEAFGKARYRKWLMEIQEADGAPWFSLMVTSLQADPSQRQALETSIRGRASSPTRDDWDFFEHTLLRQLKKAAAASDPAERERILAGARRDQITYLLANPL